MTSPIIVLTSLFSLSLLCSSALVGAYLPSVDAYQELYLGLVDQLLDDLVDEKISVYLLANGWVDSSTTEDELLTYICYAEQAAELHDGIDASLILATIAVESHFDPNCQAAGFFGLMQIGPQTHGERAKSILGREDISPEDFYDPWTNILTGTNYLAYILNEVETYTSIPPEDKELFSLMWYNQGPSSASSTYLDNNRRISLYANGVSDLAYALREIYEKGERYRASKG